MIMKNPTNINQLVFGKYERLKINLKKIPGTACLPERLIVHISSK